MSSSDVWCSGPVRGNGAGAGGERGGERDPLRGVWVHPEGRRLRHPQDRRRFAGSGSFLVGKWLEVLWIGFAELGPTESALAGSGAAVFSSLALCPTELVKCRLQVPFPSAFVWRESSEPVFG